MRVFHIVTSELFPQRGGLEKWTFDLAMMLSLSGLKVVIYTCGDAPLASYHGNSPFEVVDIVTHRTPWEEPLVSSGWQGDRLANERARLNFICLREQVAKRAEKATSNFILSNFVVGVGFTAHLVAQDLCLPHIVTVVGTDYSRGFRNPKERAIFYEVCSAAVFVVGKSSEQILAIKKILPDLPSSVIETSIDIPCEMWRHHLRKKILVFSDAGFCYKKGTGVLIDAFVELRKSGIDSSLTICGITESSQLEYWQGRCQLLRDAFGSDVDFLGYLNHVQIKERLYSSDIYCSATLGEGSSAARATALCIGIPMVTTACGELAGGAGAEHVRVVSVGDAQGVSMELKKLALEILQAGFDIDNASVKKFRERFSAEREKNSWMALIEELSSEY
ncbi:glycosyltransferase [Pseudomonas sp. JV414]|uniref:glycosyltransferase family 4 protein n=1 Tax=Pseudomonas sp. JV414 TaxID=1733110 RepID=UPI0028E18642|nr:glycosyltransferase [Pseudomonas sp. JV414]MDT9678142.1 glycosyltransferase [Pseudomonas sp. JV414]